MRSQAAIFHCVGDQTAIQKFIGSIHRDQSKEKISAMVSPPAVKSQPPEAQQGKARNFYLSEEAWLTLLLGVTVILKAVIDDQNNKYKCSLGDNGHRLDSKIDRLMHRI